MSETILNSCRIENDSRVISTEKLPLNEPAKIPEKKEPGLSKDTAFIRIIPEQSGISNAALISFSEPSGQIEAQPEQKAFVPVDKNLKREMETESTNTNIRDIRSSKLNNNEAAIGFITENKKMQEATEKVAKELTDEFNDLSVGAKIAVGVGAVTTAIGAGIATTRLAGEEKTVSGSIPIALVNEESVSLKAKLGASLEVGKDSLTFNPASKAGLVLENKKDEYSIGLDLENAQDKSVSVNFGIKFN